MSSSTLNRPLGSTASSQIPSDAALELESQLVRQTQQQLRETVAEIAELAQLPIDLADFVNGFLPRVSSAILATGVCIWRFKTDWELVGQLSFPSELLSHQGQSPQNSTSRSNSKHKSNIESDLSETFDTIQNYCDQGLGSPSESEYPIDVLIGASDRMTRPSAAHQRLLERVAQERQPILVPPRSVPVSGDRPSNPIDQTIILAPAPFESNQETYWLEVITRPAGGPATQRGYLRFVAQMADLLGDHLKSARLRTLERDQALFWQCGKLIDEIAKAPNHANSLRKLCETVRGLCSSDQVFLVAKVSSKKWRVHAASGLDAVDANSDGHQALTKIAQSFQERVQGISAVRSHSWSAKDSSTSAASLSNSSNKSIDVESDSTVQIIRNSAATLAAQRIDWLRLDDSLTPECATALIVVWSNDIGLQIDSKLASVARIVLDTCRFPWWQRVRNAETPQTLTNKLIRPWSWSKPSRIIIACLFVLAVLSLPFPMNVSSMATIHPSQIQNVFAPSNVVVRNLLVDYGQSVAANDVLVELEDSQLAVRLDQATGELINKEHRLQEVDAILRRGETDSPAKRDQLESESQSLSEQISICQKRVQLLTDQQQQLTVRANIAGVVGTWDARKLLLDRPVQAGQLLLTLHDPKQNWYVEADFQERDIQSLMRTFNTQGAKFAQVQLTSHPNRLILAKFYSVDQQTYSDAHSGKNIVRARFVVASDQLPLHNQGAAARVHVAIGTRPLGWVLMSDFVMSTWAKIRLWL